MLVQLDEIRENGASRSFAIAPRDLPEITALAAAGDYRFDTPFQVDVSLSRIGGMIEVSGRVTTRVGCLCSRCLNEFEMPLETVFEVTFTNEPLIIHDEGVDDEGAELSAEELGLIPFEGDEINLVEVVQEQVLLALPVQPLCNEACRGLCPQCGKNLNVESCSCVPPDISNKFAALKNFKLER